MSAALLASLLMASAPSATCQPVGEGRTIETAPGVVMHVRTVGQGRPVLYIPSLGRKVGDFDDLAARMARRGHMAILPEPRGAGGSSGPAAANLFELAKDYAVILSALCSGPVDVVGHAFGNRVSRALATSAPDRVATVALLAGGGEVQPTEEVRTALNGSAAVGEKPDAERLKDLQLAFFAKGNDPSVWLRGWVPAMARTQGAANRATPPRDWWTAGHAPVLLVQAEEDPIAPPGNGAVLKRDIGERLSLVSLPHASHAILPEQPEAVAAVLSAWFAGERAEPTLQAAIDERVRTPR
ncbi:alpha/beta hydrolase [Phenylobacterium sp.]|uniref:alpha/beta fold hydrolase n=1 Tax=Phenylobacterium sp. TaxID=1871053 RepID=UPI002ED8A1D4